MSASENDPRFTRAILIQLLAGPFAARGGDVEPVLRRNGVPSEVLSDPQLLVEATSVYAVMEDMAVALNDPFFCADVAREAALTGVPTLSDAAAHATSVGDFLIGAVLETTRRFDNVVYSLAVSPGDAVFKVRRTRRIRASTVQVDAAGIVFYVTILRACIGERFDAKRIRVSAPSVAGVPTDFLPASALFPSADAALSLCFPAEWLRAPFCLAWPHRAALPQYEDEPQLPQTPLSPLREVILTNLRTEGFDLKQLAASCGTSRRHLQRLFASHGTSFRSIRDDVRREVAIELVTRTPIPLQEIPWRIGLSGPAVLTRSYRRWTGTSPAAHRRNASRSDRQHMCATQPN